MSRLCLPKPSAVLSRQDKFTATKFGNKQNYSNVMILVNGIESNRAGEEELRSQQLDNFMPASPNGIIKSGLKSLIHTSEVAS